ncbi:MAG: DUF1553 domain-containing protein [Planctomycetaceae bacterium]|nr:DUF1553 domain-containing protein [Planctomycetaceae bacterium]
MTARILLPLLFCALCVTSAHAADRYPDRVLADKPVAWWRFDSGKLELHPNSSAAAELKPGKVVGTVKFDAQGATSDRFPLFEPTNRAAEWTGDGRVVITDPGEKSPLDFALGDAITFEAWVSVPKVGNGQTLYVLGKGRTGNDGIAADNQNYALRVVGVDGQAGLSFLFRNADNRRGKKEDFHRWDTTAGFTPGSGWHHIALTYQFGSPDSVRGYIDGKSVAGKWSGEYGGPTDKGPLVDNDELWIGSSMKGSKGSTFVGLIDEVALYRTALTAERIAAHFERIDPKPYITRGPFPRGQVLVEVFEGIPDNASWDFIMPEPIERFTMREFALPELPQKYTPRGVRDDRTSPLAVRATSEIELPAGKLRLLLRSRTGSRLLIDGKPVVTVPHSKLKGDGHNPVHKITSDVAAGIRPVQAGDSERVVDFESDGRVHVVTWEVYAGGKAKRPELGEASVTIAKQGDDTFRVLGFGDEVVLTDMGWEQFVAERRAEFTALNQQRRRDASRAWGEYWHSRHELAAQHVKAQPAIKLPTVTKTTAVLNEIDRFIQAKLETEKAEPTGVVDDWTFVRRVSLDLIGTVPSPEIIAQFQADPPESRRTRLIERLLAHPSWADNWVGYWQDVLAENPNIINPTLNNTGPFRWWIHESFLDNKPIDRFATELVLMDGSVNYGGAGGFSMASQNDVPMAAKAHILGQAFLGVEMKCARCHDAPYHDLDQEQLFAMAAMLNRGPQKVPTTSTIPGGAEVAKSLLVEVTLKPGQEIKPKWPFPQFIDGKGFDDLAQNGQDSREQLAALLTSPSNHRFGQMIVNRLWQRYLGRGIVEPVDDWENSKPSHPELLAWLERELVTHSYDLKHVARLILNSRLYQRQTFAPTPDELGQVGWFRGPVRRRMTAEQVVDSLLVISGKPMNVEEINIDVDGGRPVASSINLGTATRAWHFTSMSNERDRPSLSLPGAQNVINVLEAFGWRGSRQDPLTVRSQEPSVLQPAILANGVAAKRATQFSDDSAFTQLALADQDVQAYVDAVVRRVLSRPPTAEEQTLFVELLAPGYDRRIASLSAPAKVSRPPRPLGVSWSNHLKPDANAAKVQLAAELELGDPVTARLDPNWRERAEDMIWTLLNLPEFVFLP